MAEQEKLKWYSGMLSREDWWAIWLGLGLILLTMFFFWSGYSIKTWAITPGSWTDISGIGKDLATNYPAWIVLFIGFVLLFTLSASIMGVKIKEFLPGFIRTGIPAAIR